MHRLERVHIVVFQPIHDRTIIHMSISSGDTKDFPFLVRAWVHYDGLASSFSKQASNARKIKAEYETKIINELQAKKMENAIIQINGGKIKITEDKHPLCLTLGRIEDLLHYYFRNRGGIDETDNIIRFVKENRGYEFRKKITRMNDPTNIPAFSNNSNMLTNNGHNVQNSQILQ
jgi:hypothetical protein